MSYTIQAIGDKFVMNGVESNFVGDLLFKIADDNDLVGIRAESESHLLAALEYHGIVVHLLEEDGSKMVW